MTRLRYLLTSTIIVTTALVMVYTAEVMEAYREELITEIEAEREQSAGIRQECAQLEERNSELEQTLQNRTSTLSRGGRPGGWLAMPITQPSGLDAVFFEDAFAGTGLAGIGEALVGAEMETGVSALVLAGIVTLETGWGTSRLARDKNNMAGLGAYPGKEYSAGITFGSREESILYLAELLAVDYAPGGQFFGGSHDLAGIGVRYASDPRWAAKVVGCMRMIGGAAHA